VQAVKSYGDGVRAYLTVAKVKVSIAKIAEQNRRSRFA